MKKRKKPTNRRKRSRRKAKASVSPEENGPTTAAAGLPVTAGVSQPYNCRYLPEVSQFPAATISGRLPSPANSTGPITLARLFGTRGADWPRQFRLTPFRSGRPREVGLVRALAWLVSSPVLGVPRMVHGIARGVRDAARREQGLEKQVLVLRMRLETGEITQAEFEREKARIEARPETPKRKNHRRSDRGSRE